MNPMAFFPIGLLGCGSFKAVAEDKHKEDLPGSEQWDRLSSCVLHKMPWVINFSVRLSFVTRAFDQSGAVAQMKGRNCTGAEFAHRHAETTALLVCFVMHHPAHQQQPARVQTDSTNPIQCSTWVSTLEMSFKWLQLR